MGKGIYKRRNFKLTPKRLEVLKRMQLKNIGSKKPHSEASKAAIRGTRMNNPIRNWKGGIYSNKAYVSWSKNKRNRLKRGAIGSHSFEEWELLKAQYNWTCPACNKKEPVIKLTEDHIIPLSKGGSDNIENIQPLCKSCNCRKHAKTIKY